ncbi:hypothetical protein [Pontibacter sp. H249]|uniref:hypothetical protein n=1 Tax=Pontibacter sp. H249 TaxID=3133420 RepID=UPI0030BEEA01
MFMHSGFYRNGEDAEFFYPEVEELALRVMETATFYEKYINASGFVLEFRNEAYQVRLVLESFLEGDCQIIALKKHRR